MEHAKHKVFDKLPFEIVDIDERAAAIMREPGKKWVQIGPKKYCMQECYKKYGLDIYNFDVRSDDVFLIGYPRSGTTLHCEMIWQIANGLNYDEGKDILDHRFPHIDFCLYVGDYVSEPRAIKDMDDYAKDAAKKMTQLSLKDLDERKGRRFIKSHLPISLMPPLMFEVGAKIIYCARDPRDVLVSFFNALKFYKHFSQEMSIRTVFEAVKNDLEWNCPYFEHLKEAWSRRNDANFLFLFYEDTLKDKRKTMIKVANFLGENLSSDQLDSLEDHLSIEKFRKNKYVNADHLVKLGAADSNFSFIRKGTSGGWREYFVGDLEKDVNDWMERNLKDSDLKFPEC